MRRLVLVFTLALLCVSAKVFAGKLPLMPSAESDTVVRKKPKLGARVGDNDDAAGVGLTALEILKTKKRFGLGLTGGGGYGIMGLEGDFNLVPEFSVSIGWGTGIDYSSFNVKARYFLLGEWVSPYFGLGFSHWWSDGRGSRDVSPAILRNKFLASVEDPTQGYSIFMAYPCVGVQFMHFSGFSFSAEVMALFKLFNLANGTYAGASAHWYF